MMMKKTGRVGYPRGRPRGPQSEKHKKKIAAGVKVAQAKAKARKIKERERNQALLQGLVDVALHAMEDERKMDIQFVTFLAEYLSDFSIRYGTGSLEVLEEKDGKELAERLKEGLHETALAAELEEAS